MPRVFPGCREIFVVLYREFRFSSLKYCIERPIVTLKANKKQCLKSAERLGIVAAGATFDDSNVECDFAG